MALVFLPNGNIEPGVYVIPWDDFTELYGYTYPRKFMISGMKVALHALKSCNCQRVFIDGSFVTENPKPGDWDGCFDPTGMSSKDEMKLYTNYPVFADIDHPRLQQKMLFKGEIFPSTTIIDKSGKTIFELFQEDKKDKSPKGIIQISLQTFNV